MSNQEKEIKNCNCLNPNRKVPFGINQCGDCGGFFTYSETHVQHRPQPFIPRIENENSNPIKLGFNKPGILYYVYCQRYWTGLVNYINDFTIDETFQAERIFECAARLAHITFIEWPELRDNV